LFPELLLLPRTGLDGRVEVESGVGGRVWGEPQRLPLPSSQPPSPPPAALDLEAQADSGGGEKQKQKQLQQLQHLDLGASGGGEGDAPLDMLTPIARHGFADIQQVRARLLTCCHLSNAK
jgi:hypothetical protein